MFSLRLPVSPSTQFSALFFHTVRDVSMKLQLQKFPLTNFCKSYDPFKFSGAVRGHLLLLAYLRYFVPQVPITGKMLNGYPMFSVKNIVQNVKLIELWGKNLVPLHFVISKNSFF